MTPRPETYLCACARELENIALCLRGFEDQLFAVPEVARLLMRADGQSLQAFDRALQEIDFIASLLDRLAAGDGTDTLGDAQAFLENSPLRSMAARFHGHGAKPGQERHTEARGT